MSSLNCLTNIYSLSKTWKVKIKLFNWSWIMAFIDTLHVIITFVIKVKVVPFVLAHFQVLFLSSFFFWGLYFLSPLIFLLGLFTLFFHFLLFSNMRKQLAESKVCTYLQYYQSQFKIYEPYYYRTLTMAPHGDVIS